MNIKKGFLSAFQAEHVAHAFSAAIRSILDNPAESINDINLVSESSERQMWTWNQHVPPSVDSCLHEMVDEQAKRRPDAPAVCAWDGDFTFAELDDFSTRLAHHLADLGVGEDVLVPLCFEKSKWTIIAMMAILKAGGAFVPTDPSQATDRRERLFKQANAIVILASETYSAGLKQSSHRTVTVSAELLESLPRQQENPSPYKPQSAAYTIFTSGSTGQPKGVVVEHYAICSSCVYHGGKIGFFETTRCLQFCAYTFDPSIMEIFTTLVHGGCVCIPSEEDRLNNIEARMNIMDVNTAFFTPSAARLVDPERVTTLHKLLLGGEKATDEDFSRWWPYLDAVINVYGPAECSIINSLNITSPSKSQDGNIGLAVGSVSWVTVPGDPKRLAALGAIGELLVEGPILFRGYLNNEEKTRSSFVDNPPWLARGNKGHPGRRARLYNTGDLVRYSQDGSLVYVGRNDAAVKVRGHRIELGEVEHHVRECLPEATTVAAELITLKDQDATSSILAAFIVGLEDDNASNPAPHDRQNGDSDAVRVINVSVEVENALAERLPVFMMPAVYFAVKEMPLNTSGKTDRRQIRAIGSRFSAQQLAEMRMDSSLARRQPTTDIERVLQSIWARVLKIDPIAIGVDDSFFRLGGDSIAAMKIVSQARADDLSLSVADIFQHPTIAALAGISNISEAITHDDIAPFSLIGIEKGEETTMIRSIAADCGVKPAQVRDAYPCTPLQEGLLSLTTRSTGADTYVSRTMLRLDASVDLQQFHDTWNRLVDIMTILRTRIVQTEHFGLLQVVVDEAIQWETATDLNEYLENDKTRSMGLGSSLVRFAMIQPQDPSQSLFFVLTVHHALYDPATLGQVYSLASQLYRQESPHNEPVDFKHFVKYLTERDIDASETYWRSLLANYSSEAFPPVRQQMQPQPQSIEERRISLPNIQVPEITAATIVRAAWAMTASASSGTTDVVFGATVSGRHARVANIDDISGPTIATVPVRIKLDHTRTISSFLQQVQSDSVDTIPFEQFGLHHIRNLSDEARQACDFHTLLVVQPQETDELESFGTIGRWEGIAGLESFSTYAINLICTLDGDSMDVKIVFDKDVVDHSSISRLLERLGSIIRQLAAGTGDARLADIDSLSEADYKDIWSWNKDAAPAVSKCLHSFLAEQAQKRPEASAIESWDGNFTYAELDRLATQLAHHLIDLGVQTESLVPICFEKSKWGIVAMLAVLKAGGAFVPIEPSHAAERRENIIAQTGAKVILTSEQHTASVTPSGRSVVSVSSQLFESLTDDKEKPLVFHAQSPAYVIFTSGSTGQPKGVVIDHQAASTSCTAHGKQIGFTDKSRVLQFSSYIFDACIMDIFTTIIFGGCVCVPSEEQRMTHLTEVILQMKIDIAFLSTAVTRLLDPQSLPNTLTIVTGGEKATDDDFYRWRDSARIIHAYGPTECTIFSTLSLSTLGPSPGTDIGRAVGSLAWVVDRDDEDKLVPVGAVGELLMEGPTLSRGYLNDPEKTAQSFIRDVPWLLQGGAGFAGRSGRLYKTGDLVKYAANGSLTYVGRKDDQVKIRGQRVELGEVAHQVRECVPGAQMVAAEVIIPQGTDASPILAAFIKSQQDEEETVTDSANAYSAHVMILSPETEDLLAERLPSYMIPAVYISLPQIPLNTSGKTDRQQLRKIGSSFSTQQLAELRAQSSTREKRQPVTESEKSLQQIWAQILKIDPATIGVDDSFFRLGGDSIAAMKVVSQARTSGISLSVADIFRYTTIAALTSVTEKEQDDLEDSIITPFSLVDGVGGDDSLRSIAADCGVVSSQVQDAYPCTSLQEGLLSLTSKSVGSAYVLRTVLNLDTNVVDLQHFRHIWDQLVELMPILRTRIIQTEKWGFLQIVVNESIQWDSDTSLDSYLEREQTHPMGLGSPLIRFALIRHDSSCQFVLTMHHGLYDAPSLNQVCILASRLYHQETFDNPTDFKIFMKYLMERDLDADMAYWRSTLAEFESDPFPLIRQQQREVIPRSTVTRQFALPSIKAHDVTAATLVRSAWALAISVSTGLPDVAFGTMVSGRNTPVKGIENITGPTIAAVPVRVKMDPNQTVEAFLQRVQRESIDMIPHEQLGLHNIQRLSKEARLACQFQTMLVVQPMQDLELGQFGTLGQWTEMVSVGAFSTYAINLVCSLGTDGTVHVETIFDETIISRLSVSRLLDKLELFVNQLSTAADDKMLVDINALSEADYLDIWSWNQHVPPAVDRCLHDMVEEQAQRRPEAPAICAWDGNFTFAEFDKMAITLAHHLRELGVGPETLVPLCFEKSKWTIVSMLAVLKAGGAFVPIDPSQAVDRRERVFMQAEARVILASATYAPGLAAPERCVVTVDHPFMDSLTTEMQTPLAVYDPRSAAYTIFTSGSTGQPKGVVVEHYAICSSCIYHGGAIGYKETSRVLQFCAYTFDPSIMEIFTTLIHGGCVCVPSENDRLNDIETSINTMEVNIAFFTPSTARLVDPQRVSANLKKLLLGGEKAVDEDFARWWPQLEAVINVYGPAECSIINSLNITSPSKSQDANIGLAVGSVSWVTMPGDPDHLVPIGAVGELLVEGPILFRGYLHNEEKTAASFVDDPQWLTKGAPSSGYPGRRGRLYRTGDLVKYDDDGSLIYVRRDDSTVKVRGHRVDLGEVEYHLRECLPEAAIVAAEVITPGGEDASSMLAAFIVEKQSSSFDSSDESTGPGLARVINISPEAEQALAERLPVYMMPTVYFVVAQMPLNTSGKTDRRQIRGIGNSFTGQQLAEMRIGLNRNKRPPITEAECTLHRVWASVLNIEPSAIGIDDSFLRLGGDSITAMKVISQARSYGISISVADVFRHPTIAALASMSQTDNDSVVDDEILPFSLLGDTLDEAGGLSSIGAECDVEVDRLQDVYPCTPLQEGLLSLTSKSTGAAYVLRAMLHLDKDINLQQFRIAWDQVAEQLPILRTRIIQHQRLGLVQVVTNEKILWKEGTDLRHHITQANSEAADDYWRGYLAGFASPLFPQLAANSDPPSAKSLVKRSYLIPPTKELDTTIASLVRAAWGLTLATSGGTADVVFGATVSGRNANVNGIEEIAGPTMATVPVRVTVDQSQTISEFLQQVQQQSLEMIPHEQTGLRKIQALSPEAHRACQFQTWIITQPLSQATQLEESKIVIAEDESDELGFSTYALNLTCSYDQQNIVIEASFDDQHISQWQMDLLLGRFDRTLNGLCTYNGDEPLASIEAISADECRQVWEWNKTVPPVYERYMHEIIQEQARKTPNAAAVCAWDGDLTYAELEELATALSHELAARGVSCKDIVPICFEKSHLTPVAMLAVLKTGAAFTLLEPSQPISRLQEVVLQVEAKLVLCSTAQTKLCSEFPATIITVDHESLLIAKAKSTSAVLSASPDELSLASRLYLVFTSGSTGKPKGVQISHGSFSSAFHYQSKIIGFGSQRVYDFLSYAFDLSIETILMTLASGGCLCVPSETDRKDMLMESLTSLNVTMVHITPSVSRILQRENLSKLKVILFGGEAPRLDDLTGWPDTVRVINGYGPAECTPTSTLNPITKTPKDATNIGFGAGTVTWLVDPEDHNRLAPLGTAGELLIEGPLVGSGYLNEPEKTAAVFIQDPDWLVRGTEGYAGRQGRLYKTGDLARYEEDGSIVYIGRKDGQVKIRGHRVELGDVEHHVRHCVPEARLVAAEVIIPGGGNANPMLAAFLVMKDIERTADDDTESSAPRIINISTEAEAALIQRLSSYMIPAVFFALPAMPLNNSGKTDRRRLRGIGSTFSAQELAELRIGSSRDKRMPVTEIDQALQQIWADVLAISSSTIGIDDSFFSLGGDSIAAMRVVSLARGHGLHLSVADIFRHLTITSLTSMAQVDETTTYGDIAPFSLLGKDVDESNYRNLITVTHEIDPSRIQDAYPCTPIQAGLLSLTSRSAGAYVSRVILELNEKANLQRFCHSWDQLVQMVPILRTRIVQSPQFGLLQVVLDESTPWNTASDLDEYLLEDEAKPLGIALPLIRVGLIRRPAPSPSVFVLTMHHALYDAISLNYICDLLSRLYYTEPLNSPVDFKYFVRYLNERDMAMDKNYWQSALADFTSDHFPLVRHHAEAKPTCTISQQLSVPVILAPNITTATLIRVAWAAAVQMFSSTSDVVFGTMVSGRSARLTGIENIVGPTIATVPTRVKLDSAQTIFELLRQVQEQSVDMIPHEQLGLLNIQNVSDDAHHACQFQTLVVVQPPQESEPGQSEAALGQWKDMSGVEAFSTYALNLICSLGDGSIGVKAIFDDNIIDRLSVQRLLDSLQVVISQLASANKKTILADMNTLSAADYETVWSRSGSVPPAVNRCAHDIVTAEAGKRPNASALCSWDGEFTYAELDMLSTQLAHYLILDLGVEKGTMIPLCFEKSKWTVVAMLAVMKAGAAFVPIDPSQARDRRERIFEEAGASVILASEQYEPSLRHSGRTVACIGTDFFNKQPQASKRDDVIPSVDPASAAYVLFTSGSTGNPKGVIVEHRAMSSSCTYHGQTIGMTETTRAYQFAAYIFDACIMEIFSTLIYGGCICIPSDYDRLNNLEASMITMDANTAFFTPTLARSLNPSRLPLHTVILGGEGPTDDDLLRWSQGRHRKILNGYGPTECTVFCVMNTVTHSQTGVGSIIGRPVGSVSWVCMADGSNRLAPIGAVGELLVEGPTLARGYINHQSSDAFIQDPLWLLQGGAGYPGRRSRLYKTGDLVRYDEADNLIYLGRKDTQVKIRGQRLELGEVQYHVGQCLSDISSAVAVELITPEGEGASPMVAAFVVPKDTNDNNLVNEAVTAHVMTISSEAQDAIAERLPNYMIPAIYLSLSRIPLNISGKIDRRQLREIGSSISSKRLAENRVTSRGNEKAPSTDVGRALQQIWGSVLKLDPNTVGADDSFFRLGGDSISAMKVVSAAREVGHALLSLSVADIFRYPSLNQLAQRGETAQAGQEASQIRYGGASDLLSLQPFELMDSDAVDSLRQRAATLCQVDIAAIEDAYPCTALQEGLLALTTMSTDAKAYVLRLVLNVPSSVDLHKFRAVWNDMTRLFPILRTRIVQSDVGVLTQVLVDDTIPWTEGDNLRQYLEDDTANPMVLGGRLCRFALIHDPAKPHHREFVWTMHHALYDGHSLGIMEQVARQLYAAKPGDFSPRLVDFKYFSKYLAQMDADASARYWTSQLEGFENQPFPATLAGNETPASPGETKRSKCNISSIAQADITSASVLRAALAMTMASSAGIEDIVFGEVVSGRQAPVNGIEVLGGPTIATVPVRVRIAREQTVNSFLKTVQNQSVDMIPFEQFGLQRIQQLGDGPRLACQFETMLVIEPRSEAQNLLGEGKAAGEEDESQTDNMGQWTSVDTTTDAAAFASYSLNITCALGTDGIVDVEALYDSSRISEWLVELLLERFCNMAEQLASAKDNLALSSILTIPEAELKQVWDWNAEVPEPVHRCVHDIIQDEVVARPDALAVDAWDGKFAYAELDELANRLAHRLEKMGVKQDVLVPLCSEKSKWTVVARLAILKAGGAFVSLDPAQPMDRLVSIVTELATPVLVCSPKEQARWSTQDFTILTITDSLFLKPALPLSPPRLSVSPDSPMYAVFTSGSTGKPKGVVVSHSALAAACKYQSAGLQYNHQSRILDFSSYAFDASVSNLFMALTTGACLCVPTDDDLKNDLTRCLRDTQATIIDISPSVARTIDPTSLPHLATVILAGEQVSASDMSRWPDTVSVVNAYGPSECTPSATLNGKGSEAATKTSIGFGAGAVTWVVSEHDHSKLAPIGTPGELFLEGPITGSKYLNNDQMTQEAHVENPVWLVQGTPVHPGRRGRVYKTGDLVRYDQDGSLIHVGRKDAQVKLRGQRVELGEVEHHVHQCMPGAPVTAAEVIIPGGTAARPVLAVFLVFQEDEKRDRTTEPVRIISVSADTEDALTRRLPAFMVPAVYFALPEMPLNSSGKTDRRQLRAIGSSFTVQQLAEMRVNTGREKRDPSTDAERALRNIWARILNIDAATIGVDDSFFRLGGDSISAMQVSSDARATLGNISTADVLQKKTIAKLALNVTPNSHGLVLMQSAPDHHEPFDLSPIQQFYMQTQSEPNRCFDQSIFLQLRLSTSLSDVREHLSSLVDLHPMLRARFLRVGESSWKQQISSDTTTTFSLTEASNEDKAVVINQCRSLLDIERGPLLAAVLFDEGDYQSIFISVHHLVVDLVSWRVLLQDFEQLLTQGRIMSTPAISFQTWCALQQQQMTSEIQRAQLSTSEGNSDLLTFWGIDASSNVEAGTISTQFTLDEKTTSAVFGECNDAFGTRPMELLISALVDSFSTVFDDREPPTVFCEGHGREVWDDNIDISRTVGWYTTIFPATPDTSGRLTLSKRIARTKDFLRQLPDNGWSYFTSRFGSEASARKHAAGFPVEILFNYTGQYQQLERDDSAFGVLSLPDNTEPASMSGLLRSSVFEVVATTSRGCLHVSIMYHKSIHHQDRIAAWGDQMAVVLQEMASQMPSKASEWTLSDFPMAFQTYQDLAAFQAETIPELGIAAIDVEDIYPCTHMQEGILIAQAKDSSTYKTRLDFKIETTGAEDNIDVSRVEQAWRAVVQRHSLLRAVIVEAMPGSDRMMQVILKNPVASISYAGSNTDDQQILAYNKGGLQHHLVIQPVNNRQVLLNLHMNHAISDGFTTTIFMQDMYLAYHQKLDVSDAALYRDFVSYVENQSAEENDRFWRAYLQDSEPCYFPVPGEPSTKTTQAVSVVVPSLDSKRIHALCNQLEITPAIVVATAWFLVLRDFTSSSTPCFGMLLSGRDVPVADVHGIFGPLVCLVPYLVRLNQSRPVAEVLQEVYQNYLDILPHQTYPLMSIHRASGNGTRELFNSIMSFRSDSEQLGESYRDLAIELQGGSDPVDVSSEPN
nr:NRPS protein [Colletotrichum truncatum]KAF6784822.1 NRPS protein [Colletotrichum truncatum]